MLPYNPRYAVVMSLKMNTQMLRKYTSAWPHPRRPHLCQHPKILHFLGFNCLGHQCVNQKLPHKWAQIANLSGKDGFKQIKSSFKTWRSHISHRTNYQGRKFKQYNIRSILVNIWRGSDSMWSTNHWGTAKFSPGDQANRTVISMAPKMYLRMENPQWSQV